MKRSVVEDEPAAGILMASFMKRSVVKVKPVDGGLMVSFMKRSVVEVEPAVDGLMVAFMKGPVVLATGAGVVVELASGIEKVLEFLGGANPSASIAFELISLPNIKERVFCVTSYLSLILFNSSLISLHTVS